MTDEPLNRKDITGEITGVDFDFSDGEDIPPKAEEQSDEPGELNAIVGMLDMLICSSGDLLKEYDLPPPNLTVWETWGKNNLSKAMNAYMPVSMEEASSPAMAGLIGVGALLIAFSPALLQTYKRMQEPEPQETKQPEVRDRPEYDVDPAPPMVTATAPISEHALSAIQRLERLG